MGQSPGECCLILFTSKYLFVAQHGVKDALCSPFPRECKRFSFGSLSEKHLASDFVSWRVWKVEIVVDSSHLSLDFSFGSASRFTVSGQLFPPQILLFYVLNLLSDCMYIYIFRTCWLLQFYGKLTSVRGGGGTGC